MVRGGMLLGFAIVAVSLGWIAATAVTEGPESQPVAASVELDTSGAMSVLPASTAGVSSLSATESTAPAQPLQNAPKTRGLDFKSAQTHSNKCRIPDGSICYVAAQPVGSTCDCPGDQQGLIVP